MQKQYIDLPLNLEDTPSRILQKVQPFKLPKDAHETASQFLKKLEKAIKQQNQQQLYILCTVYFHQADSQKFNLSSGAADWPTPTFLQETMEEEYYMPAQTIYQELTLRKKFDRAKSNEEQFLKVVDDSWETYTSIFEYECQKVKYPILLIWEFLQNFSYQFSQYHFKLPSLNVEKVRAEWFSYDKTMQVLKNLQKHIVDSPDKKATPTSLQMFGHYSLIIRATIQTYLGNFKNALGIMSRIGSSSLSYYGKAMGSYLTLFLTPAYCYFQLGQYNKAARLCEIVALFFQKNRKYIPKIIDRHTSRQHEKIVGMLSIVYIFLEQKPKNNLMEIFKMTAVRTKDKQYKQKISDKYNKMKQHDSNAFMKLFNYSSLPLIGQKTNIDQRQKQILSRFQKLNEITFNTIIHNYKEIPIKKLAKYLKCEESQAVKKIEEYNNLQRGNTPWDSTIMFNLLQMKRKLSLNIITSEIDQQKILKIDVELSDKAQGRKDWQQYRQEISWLIEKVQAI